MESEFNKVIGNVECKLLLSWSEINILIKKIALEIVKDFSKETTSPILVMVTNGALYFGTNLSLKLQDLNFDHQIDTIGLKRYFGDGNGGLVELLSHPKNKLGGRDIIVVEDIVDDGKTLKFLDSYLKCLEVPPKSIRYCALLTRGEHPIVNYFGENLTIPNWVCGCGMDLGEELRVLRNIYAKKVT